MIRLLKPTLAALLLLSPVAASAAPGDIFVPRQLIEIQLPPFGPGPVITDVVMPGIILR